MENKIKEETESSLKTLKEMKNETLNGNVWYRKETLKSNAVDRVKNCKNFLIKIKNDKGEILQQCCHHKRCQACERDIRVNNLTEEDLA